MSGARAYVDGRFLDEERATVPVSDRAFLYGDAVFETLRTYGGVPFLLDRHLERMLESCRELGIRPREDAARLSAAVNQLVDQSGAEDCYLRLAVSRGSGYGPWPRSQPRHGRTVIVARPLEGYPEELYARGLRLATSSVRRHLGAGLAHHKTANYLESVLARREAAGEGADEALVLNSHGRVAELAAANVFAVVRGRLLTPPVGEGALPGITRGLVIELAGRLGLPVRERRLAPRQLASAGECFATNSILEVCPVAELDGSRIGRACPGPVTARLEAAYREEVARRCARSAR